MALERSNRILENGLGEQASQNGGTIRLGANQKPASNGPPPPCWQSNTTGDRFQGMIKDSEGPGG
jgi:hypothetical protein